MKNRKTFVSVFLLTFTIGYALVLPTVETKKTAIALEISDSNLIEFAPPKIEIKPDLEIIEEKENWSSHGKYPHKIKLLETGESFHGDEVDAKNGETWLGLFKENDEYFLRPTELNVRRVHDEIADYPEPKRKTGKSVGVKEKIEPIFLLKNAGKMKPGKINGLFQGLTWKEALKIENVDFPYELLTRLSVDFAQNYEIGGNNYQLKVIEAKNSRGEKISALTLNSINQRQILHTVPYGDVGKLFWVGDLDRDGKPDFFLDLYVHDNVSNTVLFLSSLAEKGNLVKKAAYFWTSGC